MRIKKRKQKAIEIWGAVPYPYGGVSVHVFRSFMILIDRFENIELINSSPESPIFPVQKMRRKKGLFREITRLLFKERNKVIHIHFNNYIGIVLFSFLFKKRLLLTLHNLSVNRYQGLKKQLFLASLRRIYGVFANDRTLVSNLQKEGVNAIQNEAFVPPSAIENTGSLPTEIIDFKKKFDFLGAMSIWKFSLTEDIYGLRQTIPLLKELNKKTSLGLVLVVSTFIDKDELTSYQQKLKKNDLIDNVLIMEKPSISGFHIWKSCDIFFRLNTFDMEGISIKESLYYDIPCIASNVCTRPADCIVYDIDQPDDLIVKTEHLVEKYERMKEKLLTENEIRSQVEDSIKTVTDLYKKLLCAK